jgi:Prenyltransferase and squalene oxidase repeat
MQHTVNKRFIRKSRLESSSLPNFPIPFHETFCPVRSLPLRRHSDEATVTNQQAKLGERFRGVGLPGVGLQHAGGPLRTTREAIQAGLGFILSQQQGKHWQDLGLPSGEADVRVTACVLARLAELPLHYINRPLQQRIDQAMEWLLQARTPNGGWGSGSTEDDAETTAWAVIALRGHRRAGVPSAALDLLRRCRRPDGGFAARPGDSSAASPYLKSTPEITAVTLRALGEVDRAGEEFLLSHLAARPAATKSQTTSFYSCSEILDWDRSMVSTSLLHRVAELTAQAANEGALEQALLLRCLLRLRMRKAWSLAGDLRALQMNDGSWSARSPLKRAAAAQLDLDDRRILATVTAVSALVLGEFQPGLYFGSDLPLPRRLPALEDGIR